MLWLGRMHSIPSRLVENCELTGPLRIASQTLPPVDGIDSAKVPAWEIFKLRSDPPSGTKTESIQGLFVRFKRLVSTPSRKPFLSFASRSAPVLGSMPESSVPVPKPFPPPTISASEIPWLKPSISRSIACLRSLSSFRAASIVADSFWEIVRSPRPTPAKIAVIP